MKINTKIALKNLAGQELKDGEDTLTLGKAVANILSADSTGGKMKMHVMSLDFYKEKEMDLDDADLSILEKSVENSQTYLPIVSGQILLLLSNMKEDSKKKK